MLLTAVSGDKSASIPLLAGPRSVCNLLLLKEMRVQEGSAPLGLPCPRPTGQGDPMEAQAVHLLDDNSSSRNITSLVTSTHSRINTRLLIPACDG